MRALLASSIVLLILAGCGGPAPRPGADHGESVPDAPEAAATVETPAAPAPQDSPAPSSAPAAPPPDSGVARRAPTGVVLAYPGSKPTGVADQTTEGLGERNRILYRESAESMDAIAEFYKAKLGVAETLSLPDRKILTGPLPAGGRVAITLSRPKGSSVTRIEVVAVTPL